MNTVSLRLFACVLVVAMSTLANAQILRRASRPACGPAGCNLQPVQTPVVAVADVLPPPLQPIAVPPDFEQDGKHDRPSLSPWQLNGVDVEKFNVKRHDAYTCSGRDCTKFEAFCAALDDDSGKLWLIVSGEGREAFLAAVRGEPSLQHLLSRTRVWSVPADHFSLKDKGFPAGSPGIYFALADGTELYSASSFAGAAGLDAIRVADPLFKPAPAPPLPTPPPIDPPAPGPSPPLVPAPPASPFVVGLGAALFFSILLLLTRR